MSAHPKDEALAAFRLEHRDREEAPVLTGAAKVAGRICYGLGYGAGRVAPKISRAARALADTKVAQFVATHFEPGYLDGKEACLEAEARAEARRMIAVGGEAAREAAESFLSTILRLLGRTA